MINNLEISPDFEPDKIIKCKITENYFISTFYKQVFHFNK